MTTPVLVRWAACDPATLAIIDDDTSWTWGEVLDLVPRLAASMLEHAGDGGRVAVVGDNRGATLMAHAAGMLAGVGTVATSRQWTSNEMLEQFRDAQVRAVVTGPRGRDAALAAGDALGIPVAVHAGDPATGVPLSVWTQRDPAQLPSPRPAQAPLVYTSGTTGKPRGTEVRWAPVTGSAADWSAQVAARSSFPPGTHLVVGPLQHNGPLSALRHLLAGGAVAVAGRFDALESLRWIERYRIASAMMVPTHFQRLLDLPVEQRSAFDVSSLRLIAHTGSACPPDVKRAMIEWFGPVLVESYGASEVGTVARIGSREWLDHPRSVGRVQTPFEVVVIDDHGAPLPAGEVGRLCFRAPEDHRPRYHDDPEKTRSAYVTEDLFTLGDIGYVDPDGFIHITDRGSDMVVSGGVNLYPAEAEAVLVDHPAVAEVAVIGVPDQDLGEALHALVVAVGAAPTREELDGFCRERIAAYKCPKSYEFVTALSRNAMGKLDKRSLRRPYWGSDRTIAG
jgi:acyl-CoA synthetase (AMP-forming)/AMP-acid ligase II